MPANPHDYAAARRNAEHLRQAQQDDFWRNADAVYAGIRPGMGERLARSSTRFWASLNRPHRRRLPSP